VSLLKVRLVSNDYKYASLHATNPKPNPNKYNYYSATYLNL